jgi:hypothetical protein
MLSQPTLRVMKKGRDVYEVEVGAARPTRHSVTAGAGDVERLTGGKATAERLIEESFRFLLERESNTSILRSFQITDISYYFRIRTRDSRPSRQSCMRRRASRQPRCAGQQVPCRLPQPGPAVGASPSASSNLSRTLSRASRLPAGGRKAWTPRQIDPSAAPRGDPHSTRRSQTTADAARLFGMHRSNITRLPARSDEGISPRRLPTQARVQGHRLSSGLALREWVPRAMDHHS